MTNLAGALLVQSLAQAALVDLGMSVVAEARTDGLHLAIDADEAPEPDATVAYVWEAIGRSIPPGTAAVWIYLRIRNTGAVAWSQHIPLGESVDHLVARARAGAPDALATLFQDLVADWGVAVAEVNLANGGLTIMFDSPTPLDQEKTVSFVRGAAIRLQSPHCAFVNVYARISGSQLPTWQQSIALLPEAAPATKQPPNEPQAERSRQPHDSDGVYDDWSQPATGRGGGESYALISLIASSVGAVGVFLPWANVGRLSVTGSQGPDGLIVLALFAIAIGGSATGLKKGLGAGARALITVVSLLNTAVALWKIVSLSDQRLVEPGAGLFLIALAGTVATVFAVLPGKTPRFGA